MVEAKGVALLGSFYTTPTGPEVITKVNQGTVSANGIFIARGGGVDVVTCNEGCEVTTTTLGMSATVTVEGVGVHRIGDMNALHTYGPPDPDCLSHSTSLMTGSPTVFAGGQFYKN